MIFGEVTTSNAAIHLVDFVNNCLERGEIPITVLFDSKNVFDKVDFSILKRRLECVVIRGSCWKWFENCLNGIFINVMICDVASAPFPVACGVPQG